MARAPGEGRPGLGILLAGALGGGAAPEPANGGPAIGGGILVAGLAMVAVGWLWRMGRFGRDPYGMSGRAALLAPLGLCWSILGVGQLLALAGVPRAFVVPLWFIGFAVAFWGVVLGLADPDWHKPGWLARAERAAGMRPWPWWNRFWLWATALFGVLALLFAALMLGTGIAGE